MRGDMFIDAVSLMHFWKFGVDLHGAGGPKRLNTPPCAFRDRIQAALLSLCPKRGCVGSEATMKTLIPADLLDSEIDLQRLTS